MDGAVLTHRCAFRAYRSSLLLCLFSSLWHFHSDSVHQSGPAFIGQKRESIAKGVMALHVDRVVEQWANAGKSLLITPWYFIWAHRTAACPILPLSGLMRGLQIAVPCILCKGHLVIAQLQERVLAGCDQSHLLIMPFANTWTENNKPIQPGRSECVRDFHLLMEAWLWALGFKAGLKFCPLSGGWRGLILPSDDFCIQLFLLFH